MRVAIVGGGIGGVAAANALLQKGIDVEVYEQAPQLKEVGAGVALHPNGVRMLRRLGFGERGGALRGALAGSAVSPPRRPLDRGLVARAGARRAA